MLLSTIGVRLAMRSVECLLARRLSLPACFGLVWLLPTAVAVCLKWQMIGGDGLTITAHYLGKVEVDTGGPLNWLASFTPLEILSFYRGELLWGLLILPAVSLLLTSGLPARWRAAVLAVASFLLTCVLYAELLSVRTVGRLLSLTLTSEAHFQRLLRATAREYFGLVEGGLLLAAAGLTVGLAWWAVRQAHRAEGGSHTRSGGLGIGVRGDAGGLAALAADGALSRQRVCECRRGVLLR